MSKSLIWFTTPMHQRSKSRFICDWLSATVAPPETSVKMTHKREADEACVVGYGACRRTEYYPNNTVRKQSRSMLDPDRGACQCTESILPTLYKRATNRYTLITPVYPNRIPTAADRTMIKIGLSFLYRSRNNATAKMPRLT